MRAFITLVNIAAGAALCAAAADPLITPAPKLVVRQDDPQLVGYMAANSSDVRSCDPTATFSTSGSFAQCCDIGKDKCNFYTACTSNTLFAAGGASVPCDFTSTLACNTALVVQSEGGNDGKQYLGCWQTTLGSAEFTIVRSAVAGESSANSTGGATSSTAEITRLTGTRSSSTPASTGSGSGSGSVASVTTGSRPSGTGAAVAVGPALGQAGLAAMLAWLVI